MKAKVKAKITAVKRDANSTYLTVESLDDFSKVNIKDTNAQDIEFTGTIKIKTLVADQMKIGSSFNILFSDEKVTVEDENSV